MLQYCNHRFIDSVAEKVLDIQVKKYILEFEIHKAGVLLRQKRQVELSIYLRSRSLDVVNTYSYPMSFVKSVKVSKSSQSSMHS